MRALAVWLRQNPGDASCLLPPLQGLKLTARLRSKGGCQALNGRGKNSPHWGTKIQEGNELVSNDLGKPLQGDTNFVTSRNSSQSHPEADQDSVVASGPWCFGGPFPQRRQPWSKFNSFIGGETCWTLKNCKTWSASLG